MRQLFKSLATAASLCASLSFVSIAQAGWWHHRCCSGGAAQAYVYVPVSSSAPQGGAQSAVWESIVVKLIEKLVTEIPVPRPITPRNGGGGGGSGGDTSFANIEKNLAALSERVENANTTLRTHGEALVTIDARVASVEAEVKKLRGDFDESSPLFKSLNEIKTKMTGKTPDQVRSAFLTPEFDGKLRDAAGDKFGIVDPLVKQQLNDALK